MVRLRWIVSFLLMPFLWGCNVPLVRPNRVDWNPSLSPQTVQIIGPTMPNFQNQRDHLGDLLHFQKCQRGPKVKGLPLPNLPADPPPLGRKRSYLSSLRWRGPPSSHQRFEISDNREERPHPHVGNPRGSK